jgi:hypothetical protein
MLETRCPHPVATYQVAPQNPPQAGIVLSHPARRNGLRVNATGALVWMLCDGQRTAGEIAQIIAEAYPESAAAIEQQVVDTLVALTDFGAVEWT